MDVFEFETLPTLIEAYKKAPPGRRRPYSLLQLAAKWGYRSPRAIGMMISGRRFATPRVLNSLSRELKLTPAGRRYLDLLLEKQRVVQGGGSAESLKDALKKVGGQVLKAQQLDLQKFLMIAAWYHLPIRQLARSPHFQADPQWISRRLRYKVSPSEAKQALETLMNLGLLVKNEEGRFEIGEGKAITTGNDLESRATRLFHQQMHQRAQEAIAEQAIKAREVHGLTIGFDPAQMDEAKEAMRDFVRDFNRRFYVAGSNRVFQMNLSLFELTSGDF